MANLYTEQSDSMRCQPRRYQITSRNIRTGASATAYKLPCMCDQLNAVAGAPVRMLREVIKFRDPYKPWEVLQ